jgi:hypothetical protein
LYGSPASFLAFSLALCMVSTLIFS